MKIAPATMVLTRSEPTSSAFTAPEFTLPEPRTGTEKSLKDVRGAHATVVAFVCNHCPFVKYVNGTLRAIAEEYAEKGVGFVAISANDASAYPADAPAKMALVDYPFPYLYDETQAVAKAYGAVCTPDFFVFDDALNLVYRGRLDAATPGNLRRRTGEEMRAALGAILTKSPVPEAKPSLGCSIKWRA